MYSAYAVIDGNEICIYDDWSDAEELRLINPQLDLERNGAGSFTFTLPPTSIAYGTYDLVTYTIDGFDANRHPIMQAHTREVDLIQRIATKIIIYRDMKDGETGMGSAFMRDRQKIWEGRVISEEKDWYNCRAVECEGDLAYLNDTCQKPALFGFAASVTDDPFTIFNHVISYHNSKVDQSKSFTVALDCTITDNRGVTGEQKQYEIDYKSSMETLQDLIKTFGGVVQVYYVKQVVDGSITWKRMIRWDNKDNVVRTSTLSPQTINFGRNLLDFKCKWDLSKLCTVAVPTGAKVENDGKDEIGDSFPIVQGTPSTGQYLLLDDDGIVYVLTSEGSTVAPYQLKDYKTAVYNVGDYIDECDTNNQERSVYLTCRLTDGLVAIGFCSKSGYLYDQVLGDTQLGQIVASPQQGYLYQDFIDYKVVLPYNCKSVAVCSYGDDIKIGLKRRKFTTTNTVTETAIDRRVGGYYDNEPYRLKFKTHQEAIPDTDPVEYREVRDEPPEVEYESNANYRVRTFPFPSDMYDAIDAGTQKIFVFGRAENNTAVFVVTDSVDGIDDPNATQLQIHEANDRNGKLEELDKYELTLSPGARSIVVVSYEGGSSSSTTIPWPKVTYNRSETKVKNSDTPKEKYVTVETATSCPDWHETGSEYVINKSLVEKYGYIERILSFESITNPDLLCQAAVQYLQNVAFDEMTIDISAIDMRALGATDTDYMNVNDELRCVSEYHGLDKFLPITSLSIPLNQPENMKVTIGETTQETMSENTNKINQDLMDSIVTNRVMTLEIAKDEAKALLIEGGNGYITLERDGDLITQLVVSTTPDPKNSNNVWVFNKNGLGHVNHYPIDPESTEINLALTSNGAIVADRITAGTLRSILLSGTHAIFGAEEERPGVRYDGSMLFCTNATGSESGYYKAIQLKSGNIRFMDYSTVDLHPETNDYDLVNSKEFARIFGKTETSDGQGNTIPMMSISAKLLALNLDELWIGTKSGYDHYDSDGNPDGQTNAAGAKSLFTDHGAIRTDSNCSLTGYTLSDPSQRSPIKVYLPKKTNPDPNDQNDWVECYVNNGILTDNTNNPYDEFQIWNGIMVDGGYQ